MQECVTRLVSLYVLTNRVAHEPGLGALPPRREAFHALAHFRFNLHGYSSCLGTHRYPCKCRSVILYITTATSAVAGTFLS